MASVSLIVGASGQDGRLLTEELLTSSHTVVYGIGRSDVVGRQDVFRERAKYQTLDLNNPDSFDRYLSELKPDVIYFLAAVHGPSGFDYNLHVAPGANVNIRAPLIVLDYIRRSPGTRLIYFNSGKTFDLVSGAPIINEVSPRISACQYTLAKNFVYDNINFYRTKYGVRATNIWLFNHESRLRPEGYFFPKIASYVNSALGNPKFRGTVDTLDFWCDWGCASQYMSLVRGIASAAVDTDVIIATGRTTHARQLVDTVFRHFGLDYRAHVVERRQNLSTNHHKLEQPIEAPWRIDTDFLRHILGDVVLMGAAETLIDMCDKYSRTD